MSGKSEREAIDRRQMGRPPGYWRAKARLERLKKFQGLIRHKERWGDETAFARPLRELAPGAEDPRLRDTILDREINRMIPLVYQHLQDAGVSTLIEHIEREPRYDKEKGMIVDDEKSRKHDVIRGYFYLPRDVRSREVFNMVMACLEQGIGIYEFRRKAALWELLNPVTWCAAVVRFPVTVLERAGLGQDPRMHERAWKCMEPRCVFWRG